MPERIPGMTPQDATVTLQIRNTGTISAKTLQITDNDTDFWDAVDFDGFGRSRHRPWARCVTPTNCRSTRSSTAMGRRPGRQLGVGIRRDQSPSGGDQLTRCAGCASRSPTPPRSTTAS